MKQSAYTCRQAATVLCSAAVMTFAGCTTYVEESHPHRVYAPPPPVVEPAPPAVVYAPPPPAPPPPAAVDVTIQAESDFYEPLSPYGEWVVVGSYGRCWRPHRVDADWRPYCNGSWQRTDAGWFWVTDEPWGWATYHYGRWDWTANFGWIWVPQIQWAPSWVAWREGAGYIGWAPLPPTAVIAVSGGVVFRDAAYAPRAFVFVEERRLCEPVRPRTVIINNTIVINKTVNITRIQVVNKRVVNEGPRPEIIERISGRKVQTVAVHDLRHREESEAVTRQPALQRNLRPAVNAERAIQPTGHTGPEPVKGVLAHQPPPAEHPAATTRQPQPSAPKPEAGAGLDRKPRQPERIAAPATAKPEVKPLPPRLQADKPVRNQKSAEVNSEAARQGTIQKTAPPAGEKQVDTRVRSAKEKSREGGKPMATDKDQKEKKNEPAETPR